MGLMAMGACMGWISRGYMWRGFGGCEAIDLMAMGACMG